MFYLDIENDLRLYEDSGAGRAAPMQQTDVIRLYLLLMVCDLVDYRGGGTDRLAGNTLSQGSQYGKIRSLATWLDVKG